VDIGDRDVVAARPHRDRAVRCRRRVAARVGGRIYEWTAEGVEDDWGEVVLWDPPARLAYRWHLRQDPADNIGVEIRFVDLGGRMTRMEIEHRGWERLGQAADDARFRNQVGWDILLPHNLSALTRGHK